MSLLRVLPIALCLMIPVAGVSAQEGKTDKPAKPAADATHKADDMYAVVKVGADMKVLKSTEVATLKSKMATEHEKAMKDYEAAKKAAEAEKKPFTAKAPMAHEVSIVKGDFKTMTEAQAYLDKEMAAKKKDAADPAKKKDAPPAHGTEKK